MRQALAAERAGGPTEEAEHPSATARTIRASPEDETGPTGPPGQNQLKHPDKGVLELKSNLISAIAGWKSAALLALVAMVAAVAFSGVLTNTQTAEARISTTAKGTETETTVSGNNGQIFYITNGEGTQYVQFVIATTGGASASFIGSGASGDGQSITCVAASATVPSLCDANDADSAVTVALKIDDDSGAGAIFIRQTVFTATGTPTVTTDTIRITVAQVPARISASSSPTAVNSAASTTATPPDNVATISFRLTDTNGKGIGGASLTITATHGTLGVATEQPAAWTGRDVETTTSATDGEHDGLGFTGASQAGTITTSTDDGALANRDGAGYAAVTLTGGGVPGIATVTARLTTGTTSGTANVTLYGSVAAITAEADSSAIALGEHTFVVVTATDAAGNPVANATASTKAVTGVVGPDVGSNVVSVVRDTNRDRGAAGTVDAALGDLPSCDPAAAVAEADQTDGTPPLRFASSGTNAAGKCVLRVEAIGPSATVTNPMDFTSRGTHTLTIVASADGTAPPRINESTVEIQVGGAPATISSDAPALISPSDELTVNVTVVDDEDVRVGAVTIEVIQTAGDGKIITEARPMTADGGASFTYLAPSTPGTAEFLVRTKDGNGVVTAQLPIIVAIGEAPAEVPDAPPATWNNELVSGPNTVVWNGDDGADPSDGAAEGVSAIWQYNSGTGTWDGYFPDAADVPGGNTLTSLENNEAYTVIVD